MDFFRLRGGGAGGGGLDGDAEGRRVGRGLVGVDVAEAAVNWLNTLPFTQFCSLIGIDERQLAFVNKPFS